MFSVARPTWIYFSGTREIKALRGSALCANGEDLNALLALVLVDRYVGAALEKNLTLNFVAFVPFLIFGTHNTDLDTFRHY